MSLLVFVLIVFVVLALACWAVYFLPLPPGMGPPYIKNFIYVVLLIIAIIVILARSGLVTG
jgi:hypothetical protein